MGFGTALPILINKRVEEYPMTKPRYKYHHGYQLMILKDDYNTYDRVFDVLSSDELDTVRGHIMRDNMNRSIDKTPTLPTPQTYDIGSRDTIMELVEKGIEKIGLDVYWFEDDSEI